MADEKDSVSTSTDESSFEDESSQEDLHSISKSVNPSIPSIALTSVNESIQKVLLTEDGAVHWNNEHEHSFLDAHFNKPTFCEYCSDLIFALEWKQGAQCKACHFTCHKKCAQHVPKNCQPVLKKEHESDIELLDSANKETQHTYYKRYFKTPTFCNVCRTLLVGVVGEQGSACSQCRYVAHFKCQDKSPHTCPITKFGLQKPLAFRHYWIEGNLKGECSICQKNLSTINCLYGYRCYWCEEKFCNSCHTKVHENSCDLGRLRALKIPPTGFITGGSKAIADWSVKAPPGSTPLVVFINKKSGGQQGPGVIRRFCMHINPNQILDLAGGGPAPGLKMFKDVPNFKVLACGGDGTVAWVLDVLDKLELPYVPAVAPLPLGTANDLSRTLGWGGGYEGEPVKDILKDLERAQVVLMDRWILHMNEKDLNSGEFSVEKPRKIINNYFSIGIDAKIALSFHTKREESPKKFKSRTINKVWYAKFGADAIFDAGSCDDLPKKIRLEVDDQVIVLPDDVQGVMCTNLQSYMGGVDLWSNSSGKGNKAHYEPATIDDKLLEIVAIKGSLHLGQIKTGTASTVKVTQGRKVKITWLTDENIPFQIDGEPWDQPPCTLTVSHHNQAKMLAHPKRLASGKINLSPRRPNSLESNTNQN